MKELINDIWILTEDMKVILKLGVNNSIHINLFTKLLDSLNIIVNQITEKVPNEFIIKNKKFVIIRKRNLIFISNFPKKIRTKIAKSKVENIINIFFELFNKQDITNIITGDLSKIKQKIQLFKKKIKFIFYF